MKVNKLALFDFCETLVSIQSADRFIDFIRSQQSSLRMHFLEKSRLLLVYSQIFRFINKIFPHNTWHKELKLYQLKGLSKAALNKFAEQYYHTILKPKLISKIVDQLRQKQKLGYKIMVISGGYSLYLQYFAIDFKINSNDVVATDINFDKHNICTGRIAGLDCMHNNKIVLLKQKLGNLEIYNLSESVAYSDSISDLPMLTFVGHGIVVSSKKQVWASQNKFKEIVWST